MKKKRDRKIETSYRKATGKKRKGRKSQKRKKMEERTRTEETKKERGKGSKAHKESDSIFRNQKK